MHGWSHDCTLYAGMKHVTTDMFYMPNIDVCEYINDIVKHNSVSIYFYSS